MAKSSRWVNLFVYLLPVVGWLVVFLGMRRNLTALYHASQALALNLGLVLIPAGWAIFAWVMAWIPLVGPVTGVSAFSLVIAAVPALLIAWLLGMVNALRDEVVPVPIFGGWGDRIFKRMTRAQREELPST